VARLEANNLVLQVFNSRPTDNGAATGDGVGLRNAAERLRLLFGPRAVLSLDLSQAGLAIAEMRLLP
jgi:hypothetical protein